MTDLPSAGQATAGAQSSPGADVQAWETFYRENFVLMYRFVYSKVANRKEAEDVTAQICLKAMRGIETERGPLRMQKWLYQVARTTVAGYWRTHYRVSILSLDALLVAGWEGPAEEERLVIKRRSVECVQRILQAPPENYRDILMCRFVLSLSIKETATQTGLSETNVKQVQFRALKHAAGLEHLVVGKMESNPIVER